MEEKRIDVHISIFGASRSLSLGKEHELKVSPDLAGAVDQVKIFLEEEGYTNLYILYLNDVFVKTLLRQDKTHKVAAGDVFKVIPMVAGG